jgi:prolyl 4-hydroxylase
MTSHYLFFLLLVSLNCVQVISFSTPLHLPQSLQYPTSTSWLAAAGSGGGFGANSKSKESSSTKKTNKAKSKSSIGFLDEMKMEVSTITVKPSVETSTLPKLDRFGLPIPTDDDIFPPLPSDIPRTPIDTVDYPYNREEVADAMKNHLGLNLYAFDEHGYSTHHEEQTHGEPASTRWSLKLLHKDPPVFKIDNFFTAEECDFHKSLVDPNNSNRQEGMKAVQIRSPTFSSYSISRRTSTTWFCRYEEVPTFLSKAQQLLNNVNLSQMEEPQIVRYRTGEEFSWHYDEIPSAQLANGGQRLATLLVYLNDLDEDRGGGTVFRDLTAPGNSINPGSKGKRTNSITTQLTVRPTKGTALLFFPSYKDGTPDPRTLHKGEVALENKMIAQLWIHERDYLAGVPDGNLQSDAMDGVEEVAKRLGFMQ